MSIIRRSISRVSQPPVRPEIDWANPITRELAWLYTPTSNKELVSNASVFPSANHKVGPVPGGIGLSTAANGGFTSSRLKSYSDEFTLFSLISVGRANSSAAVTPWISCGTGVAGSTYMGESDYSEGVAMRSMAYYWPSFNGVADIRAVPATNMVAGEVAFYATTFRRADAMRIYKNGRLAASTPTSNLAAQLAYFPLVTVGGATGSTASVLLSGVSYRAWSEDELSDIAASPWQFFKPQRTSTIISLGSGAPPERLGNLTAVETSADTAAFTGESVTPEVPATATVAVVETGTDTAAFAGASAATGNLTTVETGSDTVAFAGASAAVGNLIAVETGADKVAFAGASAVTGNLTAVETGADTVAFAGASAVTGNLTAVETGSDTFSATEGNVVRTVGAMSATESSKDGFTGLGQALASGNLAVVEAGSDTATATGSTLVQGSFAVVEVGSDTAGFEAASLASGKLAASELADSFAAVATAPIAGAGTLYAVESGTDTAAFTGAASSRGDLTAQEESADQVSASGYTLAQGTLGAVESGADTFSAAIPVAESTTGVMAATESGQDTSLTFGYATVTCWIAATESGSDRFVGGTPARPTKRPRVVYAQGRRVVVADRRRQVYR